MTTTTLTRGFFAVPVLGWIARDVATKGEENFWYALVIFLTCMVLAVKIWGVVALSVVAMAAVPVMFAILIAITQG
ncbi:MAG: hypothetical protein KGI94_16065 [Paracoccaceae bacterium]|nr:hypothetical protein [Paracoccaceae bacterium]MDE3123287.1 hypothetical protein [Paracoccaceae bacterium]MDE3237792.1 hypothetical protein [Paracoccaceae bacterium]